MFVVVRFVRITGDQELFLEEGEDAALSLQVQFATFASTEFTFQSLEIVG
jgi:hypothetical protein